MKYCFFVILLFLNTSADSQQVLTGTRVLATCVWLLFLFVAVVPCRCGFLFVLRRGVAWAASAAQGEGGGGGG